MEYYCVLQAVYLLHLMALYNVRVRLSQLSNLEASEVREMMGYGDWLGVP